MNSNHILTPNKTELSKNYIKLIHSSIIIGLLAIQAKWVSGSTRLRLIITCDPFRVNSNMTHLANKSTPPNPDTTQQFHMSPDTTRVTRLTYKAFFFSMKVMR
jgi:hypothetical protein